MIQKEVIVIEKRKRKPKTNKQNVTL